MAMRIEAEIVAMLRELTAEQAATEDYYQKKIGAIALSQQTNESVASVQHRYEKAIAQIESKRMALYWVLKTRDSLV